MLTTMEDQPLSDPDPENFPENIAAEASISPRSSLPPLPEPDLPDYVWSTPERWLEPPPAPASPSPPRQGSGFNLSSHLLTAFAASVLTLVIAGGVLLATGGQIGFAPSPTRAPNLSAISSPGTGAPGGSIEQAAAAVTPAVVTVLVSDAASGSSGSGSGIVFNAAGWVLTNRHVISGASSVSVRLIDGRQFTASVYGIDTLTDLAIVRLDAPPANLAVAVIGSSADLQPGQTAVAIGSPLGTFSGSVTAGIISALGRSITASGGLDGSSESLDGLIQTDAAINPGNSGGALANLAGAVIGINTATATSAQAIGFAIPIDFAKPLMAEALAGKPLARPYLGVRTVGLPAPDMPGAPALASGAWVTGDASGPAVSPGSAAAAAGIVSGDVIISLDGIPVDSAHPLDLLLAAHAPGDRLAILVSRNGANLSLTAVLGTRPNNG